MAPMGRLVINNAVTVNGAFEAPVPEPDRRHKHRT
jgi:hypothetical protein